MLNKIEIEFDGNSNVIKTTRTDVNPSGRISNEVFVTINVYDSLNRLERITNNIGQTSRLTYDSRNLVIQTTDAQGLEITDPLGKFNGNINADGNTREVRKILVRKYL